MKLQLVAVAGASVALVLWTTTTASGRDARHHLFGALRIARPEAVSVNVPAFSGPTGSRRLQDAVAAMLADDVHVAPELADTAVADGVAAARVAGYPPAAITARKDKPSWYVETARAITMRVDLAKLRTIVAEAGQSASDIPASVDHSDLTITTPAAVRLQYGHCPSLEGQTLTNQIAQRPPPSTESADCVILEQRPFVQASAPPGLDMERLTGIALEVAGMSPVQRTDFQHAFQWPAALALVMPRFMRSYDTTSVNGARAMLVNTAFRRGPNYELVWTAANRVYVLTGYGNSADAVTLAASVK